MGGPLQRYRVVTAGGHETVIKYNVADAERNGLTDEDLVDASEPRPVGLAKGGSAQTTGRTGSANKGRTAAQNKAPAKGSGRKTPAPSPVPTTEQGGGQAPAADPGGDGGIPPEPVAPADGG